MAAAVHLADVTIELFDPRKDEALYSAEKNLRAEVLAAPVGLLQAEFFPFELDSLHLIATVPAPDMKAGKQVVGCVLFCPDQHGSGRMFQMAVAPVAQGLGLGSHLVRKLETELQMRGTQTVTLHSRLHVAGFYEKLGYTRDGDEYEEVGIPHVNMSRTIHQVQA